VNNIDVEAEREHQKELTYLQGFLKSVTAKLSTKRFLCARMLEAEIVTRAR